MLQLFQIAYTVPHIQGSLNLYLKLWGQLWNLVRLGPLPNFHSARRQKCSRQLFVKLRFFPNIPPSLYGAPHPGLSESVFKIVGTALEPSQVLFPIPFCSEAKCSRQLFVKLRFFPNIPPSLYGAPHPGLSESVFKIVGTTREPSQVLFPKFFFSSKN